MRKKGILRSISLEAAFLMFIFILAPQLILGAPRHTLIFDKTIRDEFNTRINELRKDRFDIFLLAKNGAPIRRADVTLEQKNHEFIFGGAITTALVEKGKYRREKRRLLQRADQMFNMVVDGNGFKWKNIERERGKIEYGFHRHNLTTKWAKRHNKKFRHHCLFWANPKHNPDWLQNLSKNEFRAAILNRIRYTKVRAGSEIKSLDLINEMLYFRYYRDRLGEGIIREIFDEAKKAFPQARIFLNENPLQSGKAYTGFHDYIQLLVKLKKQRVPLDGIGIQAHFDAQGFHAANIELSEFILKMNDLAAEVSVAGGMPVLITEYDMKTSDENLRADFLEAFYTMVFSNRHIEGVIAWEWFDEKRKRALVNLDGSLTEAGKRYNDLVFGKWWTTTSGATSVDGIVNVDAFFGDYEITITKNEIKHSFNLSLRKDSPRKIFLTNLSF